ncbi:MAG TPA: RIP metalloprotease RseP [Bryobacteraceae bacterium]|nr:RIP metalloprotease RseP [Bryobacteraceae bacterium]
MTWVDLYPVVILLGVMILIHELGHYWAAISVGIRVDTFSIGFGPRLFGFKRGDTDFRISAIPLGGYVRMFGELPGDDAAADPRSFLAKARWQRAIVVVAGPLMNVLLAIAIVTGLYMHSFRKEVDPTDPVITTVEPGSAAARAGIQPGDKIVAIEAKQHPNWEDVLNTAVLNARHPIPVVVERKGARLNLTVTPALDPKLGIGDAGWNADPDVELSRVEANMPAAQAGLRPGDLIISINHQPVLTTENVLQQVIQSGGRPAEVLYMRGGQIQKVFVTPIANKDSKLPWRIGVQVGPRGEIVKLGFGSALVESIRWNGRNATLIFDAVRSLVERRVSPKSLQGPIQIARMSTEAVQAGAIPFFGLMAIVSLNLAIINLLPIPILDGGTLLMLIIEMLMQREVSLQVKETAFKLGFVFLMMVVVFVIYNDITHVLSHG